MGTVTEYRPKSPGFTSFTVPPTKTFTVSALLTPETVVVVGGISVWHPVAMVAMRVQMEKVKPLMKLRIVASPWLFVFFQDCGQPATLSSSHTRDITTVTATIAI